jgi:hypothetical protein
MSNHHDDSRDDATLVAQALAGAREAFNPLLLRYYPSVMRLCRRLLGPTFEAQDIAQEAALQSFLSLSRLQEPERFGAWLHAIAANLARMELRRRRMVSLDALGDGPRQIVLWSQGVPTPEEIHAAREAHDAIVAALSDLSLVNREVVIGFYLKGYRYVELAELLGVPVSTVKGRLFKGRRQLQRALGSVAHDVLKPDRRIVRRKGRLVEQLDSVKVTIDSMCISTLTQNRVMVLKAEDSDQIVPIFIGPFEADSISLSLQGLKPARPMTHDVTLRMIEQFGARIKRVVINKILDQTFYAEITMVHGDQTFCVDARPSDAVALAVRTDTAIYVAREVLDKVGAPVETEIELAGNDIVFGFRGCSGSLELDTCLDDFSSRRPGGRRRPPARPSRTPLASATQALNGSAWFDRHRR